MKTAKKILALLLVACMACAMLSACGSSTSSGDEIVVTVWSGETHAKAAIDKVIAEFNNTTGKEKGIRIDYQFKGGDTIGTNVELALQTGDAPDLFTSADLKKSVEQNYLAAIDDLPGGADLIKPVEKYLVRNQTTYQGKTYVLPAAATTRGLIVNVDMFKAAGLVDAKGNVIAPETLDDVREYAKKLTGNGKYGFIEPLKWGSWYNSDIFALKQSSTGFSEFNYETGEYNLDGLEKIEQLYLDMKADGSMFPGAESLDNDAARAQFAEGKVGMKFGFSFDVGVLNDQFPAKCDWTVVPLPVIDANNKYAQRMTMATTPYINANVLKDEKKANAIVEVLKFITSDEYQTALYEAGIYIPIRSEVSENADASKINRKGWAEFASMVSISKLLQPTPQIDSSTIRDLSTRFNEEVWSGKKTPKQAHDEYLVDLKAAREAFLKTNPEDKLEDYIIKDWIQKR